MSKVFIITLCLVVSYPQIIVAQNDNTDRRIERLENKIDEIGDNMKTVVELVVKMQQINDEVQKVEDTANKNSRDMRVLERELDSFKKKISFLFDGLYGIWTLLLTLTSGGVTALVISNFSKKRKSE